MNDLFLYRKLMGAAFGLVCVIGISSAESIHFIPATPQNTFLADGSPLPEKLAPIGWQWLPDKGNAGMWESIPDRDNPASMLMVKASRLDAGVTYEVFGYFMAAPSTAPQNRPVQFGLSIARMQPFDGVRPDDLVQKEPWVITPTYETGKPLGYEAVIEMDDPLPGLEKNFSVTDDSRLIRARLGFSRAGKNGTLPVFFDQYASFHSTGGASVVGVALRQAAPHYKSDLLGNSSNEIHQAIRTGDTVTLQREIEAGADLNVLDEENLTPLFYATACGDAALVKKLLALGVHPELETQAVSPLVAAASDSELTRILLQAGAKVPLNPAMDTGRLAREIDPWFLHPVIAAIRSGSVPVLQQLLAANPAIRLDKIATDWKSIDITLARQLYAHGFVSSSMIRQNWDMAVFLTDNGFPLFRGDIRYYKKPDGVLLSRAVMAGPQALALVEAMLRRGEPPVVGTSTNMHDRDALTSAAWLGNADLVRRFLPFAMQVDPRYPTWLLEHALYSENQEVIDMIRQQFPDVTASRWEAPAEKQEDTLEQESARSFLPRTSPPTKATAQKAAGKLVLAVIAAPESCAASDTLAAFASTTAGWHVVERDKIETALLEDRFSKPWLDGEHRLSELGDRLTADCLIVVSALRNSKEVIHRFEVVEVATGLEIHREHLKDGAFVDQKEIAGFLSRAAHAMDAASRNERHQAVTLLTFTAQGMKNPLAMSRILGAAVKHEVDATPGLISLSRSQSARITEEQTLGGKNSIWGAAHMIEGIISSEAGNNIHVTLRLETYKDGKTTKNDVTASGDLSSIPETTAAAWKKLMATLNQEIITPRQKPDAPDQALNEGKRLMREAEWLHSLGSEPDSYLPLIESAIALGAPSRETIMLHLDGYYCHFWPPQKNSDGQSAGNPSSQLQKIRELLPNIPASLALSDRFAHILPKAQEFVDQTSWYLDREGVAIFNTPIDIYTSYKDYKSNEIWYAIQALSNIRALIFRKQLTDQQREQFAAFSADLDALTSRYFSLLKTVPQPDFIRYHIQSADFRLYERNPTLVEGLVELAASGASLTTTLSVNPHMDPDSGQGERDENSLMVKRKEMAKKIIDRIGNNPAILSKLAKADLECFIADHSHRSRAIQQLVEISAEAKTHISPTRQKSGSYLLSQTIVDSCTTSLLFDRHNIATSLDHQSCLVPHVLFSSRAAPDSLIRYSTYHKVFHLLNQRAAWTETTSNPDIDKFRQRIGGYFPWELRRLETEARNAKQAHGAPTLSGNYSYAGPPGFFAPTQTTADLLKSNPLVALFYGAGKKPIKTNKPINPPEKSSQPKALSAKLLADLRTDKSPGFMVWPLVDSANSDLLWTFYFPSSSDAFHVNVSGGSGLQIRERNCKAPWLLGIDCRTGTITRKINLHSAVGEAYGLDLANRKCAVWDMAFDQTRSRILTNVGWFDKSYASNKMGSVIIDKDTGKAHPLPRNPQILEAEGSVLFDIWDNRIGVVGIGEHFYYLDKAGDWNGGAIQGVRSDKLAIFEVSPELTVKPLTVMGRKPELTPFDSADRAPMLITRNDNQLRVVQESTVAEFDPKTQAWTIVAGDFSRKPTKADFTSIADARYWEFLQSIHELQMNGKTTGWFAVGWDHRPGFLPLASREKGIRQFRITAEIPDDFLTSTYAIDSSDSANPGKPNEVRTLFKDHPRSKNYNMVVLAQTETDLILGIQTSDYYEWNRPSRNAAHLPFLWKVSKQEILNQLNND